MASYNLTPAQLANLNRSFPRLASTGFTITSPATNRYNCIAWAAGDDSRWWWPTGPYWPNGVPKNESVAAFEMAYCLDGYTPTTSEGLEVGYQKIALYALNGLVSHACRQLLDGWWTSKLGPLHDISHTLYGLEGPAYGQVALILRRFQGQSSL